jgi:hypothetical protein
MVDYYFNPLEYAHDLEKAGVPAAQAELQANTLARFLEKCVLSATASAVPLRAEISEAEKRLRGEIKDAAIELRDRIDKLETRINWISGVIVATQLGLFAMVAGLYLR